MEKFRKIHRIEKSFNDKILNFKQIIEKDARGSRKTNKSFLILKTRIADFRRYKSKVYCCHTIREQEIIRRVKKNKKVEKVVPYLQWINLVMPAIKTTV